MRGGGWRRPPFAAAEGARAGNHANGHPEYRGATAAGQRWRCLGVAAWQHRAGRERVASHERRGCACVQCRAADLRLLGRGGARGMRQREGFVRLGARRVVGRPCVACAADRSQGRVSSHHVAGRGDAHARCERRTEVCVLLCARVVRHTGDVPCLWARPWRAVSVTSLSSLLWGDPLSCCLCDS